MNMIASLKPHVHLEGVGRLIQGDSSRKQKRGGEERGLDQSRRHWGALVGLAPPKHISQPPLNTSPSPPKLEYETL